MKIGRNDPCICGSGEKFKNCCIDYEYYYSLFIEQNNLMKHINQEEICNQIINIGDKIVSSKNQFKFTTGAYTNMANAYIQLSDVEDNFSKSIALAEKALELKSKNYQAMLVMFSAYMLKGEYSKAYITLSEFQGLQLTDKMKNQIFMLYQHSVNESMCASVKRDELNALKMILDTMFDIMGDFAPILCLAHEFYRGIGDDVLKAYEFGKKCIESWENAEVLCSLGFTCINETINKPEEGIKYLNRAIEIAENKEVRLCAKTNLVSVLIMNKNYSEAKSLVMTLLDEMPSNANYSNYAELLKREGLYEEAIKWCKKALFLVEDDTTLLVLADIFKKNLQYDEAIKTFIKCISAIESQGSHYRFVDIDSVDRFSYAAETSLRNMALEAYRGVVESYSKLSRFSEAKAYLTIGLDRYPDDRSLESLGMLLSVADDAQSEYERAKEKLEREKEISVLQRNCIRGWAIDLMLLQNESFDFDLDEEECWEHFEGKMDEVILSMKESAINNEELLNTIEEDIEHTFPSLNDRAKELLRTANYLYEIHKEAMIDFAPIIVEYSKIVEVQLREKLQGVLTNHERMLGQILGKIDNDNIDPYFNKLEDLRTVNNLRKSSAHIGVSELCEVDKIRNVLFQDGLLDFIS